MPRSFRHWTPRYIVDRVRLFTHERTHPDDPWLTSEATKFLDGWLRKSHAGLEWGTGRSTIWIAARVGRLLAVEHDRGWHREVKDRLARRGLENVDLRLVPTDTDHPPGHDHPYVAVAATLPAKGLDFVLVDGVLREHCAEAALWLVRPGGILIVDNANWFLPHETRSPASVGEHGSPPNEVWARVWQRLNGLRMLWTSNGVTDTAVFFVQ